MGSASDTSTGVPITVSLQQGYQLLSSTVRNTTTALAHTVSYGQLAQHHIVRLTELAHEWGTGKSCYKEPRHIYGKPCYTEAPPRIVSAHSYLALAIVKKGL